MRVEILFYKRYYICKCECPYKSAGSKYKNRVSQAIMNRQIPVFGLFEPYAEAEVRHFFNCSPLNDETIGKTERLHCAASIGSNDISFR